MELRGVSGVLESRAAQRGEEGRQVADAAASRAHAGSATERCQPVRCAARCAAVGFPSNFLPFTVVGCGWARRFFLEWMRLVEVGAVGLL